ncbi:MAG: ribonuclease HII, partial [Candidatus Tectomicrobia bacterium]|nr:ribonuclease HII [Candidatus Tectomicrobia bacterium]
MARRHQPAPSVEPFELEARSGGHQWVAGVDEAGRGPLAGPVVAAAVILPANDEIPGLQDSKQLTLQQRERAYAAILNRAVSFGLGIVSHAYIDQHNILQATLEAMRQAAQQLTPCPDLVFVDGTMTFPSIIAQRALVKGDARCASIAAASIVAKVTRDQLMTAYAKCYPAYGFETHKGYPTREHYRRLRLHGPC